MSLVQTRRSFLTMAGVAGAAGLLPLRGAWAGGAALETTTAPLARPPGFWFAPQYVCAAVVRADGFTDVRYVNTTVQTQEKELGRGELDFQSSLSLSHAIAIDAGVPITVVTGVHAGCYELFAHGSIRGIADLKEKSVGLLGGS